jgi:hypothetical protein
MKKPQQPSIVEPTASQFTVYRPNKKTFSIRGTALTVDVRDGSLLILSGGEINRIFSPGQWITVNEEPV